MVLSKTRTLGHFRLRLRYFGGQQSQYLSTGRHLCCAPNQRAKAYIHVPGTRPLLSITLGQVLEDAADAAPDTNAIISTYQNTTLTYDELRQKVDKLAAGFRALGLSHGDRIAMWGPNSVEWILTKMAAARAGLVLVSLNPAYQSEELSYALKKVGVKGLVCNHTFRKQNYYNLLLGAAPDIGNCAAGNINSSELPDLRTVIVIGDEKLPAAITFSDALEAGTPETAQEVKNAMQLIESDDICEVQFTSGTTGKPKAAMLSHFNMVNNADFTSSNLHINNPNSFGTCAMLPFFHVYGGVIVILGSFMTRDTLVIPSATFVVDQVVEAIKTHKCTAAFSAPSMLVDMYEYSRKREDNPLKSLEIVYSGAGGASTDLLLKINEVAPNAKVRQGYGMTETSPCTFQFSVLEEDSLVLKHVGKLAPHLEAKIIDSNGKTVRFGEKGELCIRGYVNCRGYWEDPEKTRELIGADGWLHTGDQFILTEEGYSSIVGRIKELIIRGGENIAPKEVEDAIGLHPNVVEVAVFGVPDKRFTEEVAAAVRLRDSSQTLTTEELRSFLKGKVSHFKIPKYLDIVSEFPKTPAGKIRKFILQENMEKRISA